MKIKPRGNNSLNSKHTFLQREHYENTVDDFVDKTPNLILIDLYKKPLYGKINLKNEIIVPNIRTMKVHQGQVHTFSFISNALDDLSAAIERRITNGTMRSSGPYSSLQVAKRKNDWRTEYVEYLKSVESAYKNSFHEHAPEKRDEITDFKKFTSSFLDFVALVTPSFQISFSQYYISRQSSIFPTGFAIELSDEFYGDDNTSYSQYFEDINFPIFAQEAQNHGFILDKHAPWRLIANLNSKPMTDYMKRNGYANMDDVFSQLFFSPVVAEFNEFVKLVHALYFAVFPADADYAEVCYKDGKTSFSVKPRETLDPANFKSLPDMISYLGYPFWIRAFCFLKVREANKNFTQKEFDDFVREVEGIKKYVDIEAALVYINKTINPLMISNFDGKPTFSF